jgi:hypothetical protein
VIDEGVRDGATQAVAACQDATLYSPLLVAAYNQVQDVEDHDLLSPVPAGWVTCKLADWQPGGAS